MTRSLRLPVTAYLCAIVPMVSFAIASGSEIAAAGAIAFMMSDTLIGWRRFVADARWMGLAIIVLYHLGQLGLALFLIV